MWVDTHIYVYICVFVDVAIGAFNISIIDTLTLLKNIDIWILIKVIFKNIDKELSTNINIDIYINLFFL